MLILFIIRILIFLILLLVVLTQIVFPLLEKRKMFPMFSKRRNAVRETIVEANEEIDLREKEKIAQELKIKSTKENV